MRVLAFVATLGVVAAASQTAPPAANPQASAHAEQVLSETKKALGGDKLATVTTLVATGRTRQIQGDNLVPVEFELSCAFPDKCVRRDEVPAKENGPTFTGFNGDALILLPAPNTALPEAARKTRLDNTRQEFARLLLGFFGSTVPGASFTSAYVGQAEAPQGSADVVDITGPGNLTARVFVSRDTHLPIMLSWQAPGRGGPTENRLFYGDYRETSGFQWPYRIRRAVGADTVEEIVFDRFRVNPKLDAKVFGAR